MHVSFKRAYDHLIGLGVGKDKLPDEKEASSADVGTKWDGKLPNSYSWEIKKKTNSEFFVKPD